jgi:hypothetical protein
MEFWQQILVLTLTPTVVVTAVTYLLRKLFERTLSKDLERFKSDLQIKQAEFQTRFSALHEKRIEIIGELYARLVRATQSASDLVELFQYEDRVKTLPSKKVDAFDSMSELDNYFQALRVYFDTVICEKMDSLIKGTHRSIGLFSLGQRGETYQGDDTGTWQKAWEKMEKEVGPIKTELEKQFRELIEPKSKTA